MGDRLDYDIDKKMLIRFFYSKGRKDLFLFTKYEFLETMPLCKWSYYVWFWQLHAN